MSKEKIIESAEKLVKAGKYDKAIKEYQKLLADDPHDMRAKLKVADIYARNKEIATAIKIYREVAESFSHDNFHLKAIAVYKTVLTLSPTLIEINEKLGDLYHKVGLDNDATNQYYIVATYYDKKGLTKEAMEVRKKILTIDPGNTTGRIRLAELLQVQGQSEEAIREYQKVADILTEKQDRDGLIEVYEKMLYYRPDNAEMLIKLCHLYFDRREFKRALKKIESSPPKIKESLDISALWAEALLEDHQVEACRRKFKEIYASALEKKDYERADCYHSRMLQEFGDDQDYLNDIEEIRKTAGLQRPAPSGPKFRQDFERTDIIDLGKVLEDLKKK